MTYHFTLYINREVMSEDDANAIYEVASDCSCGSGHGRAHVAFHRQSGSLEKAIATANADIAKAGFTVAGLEMDRDDLNELLGERTTAATA